MNNARIGPDSPIEVPAGGSYDALVVYPVPDGPLYPLKADVTWWIEPAVKGIFIEAKSGKITVARFVPIGTTATLHADVAGRKEKLDSRLFVYSLAKNPLVGAWTIEATQPCRGREVETSAARESSFRDLTWRFSAENNFSIGRPYGIRAGLKQDGSYAYDRATGKLKLKPKWPAGKHESDWHAAVKEDGSLVQLTASKPPDGHQACGYTLTRVEMKQ